MSATFASTSRERGPASTSTPVLRRHLVETDASVGGQKLLEQIEIVRLKPAGRNEIEPFRPEPRQRELRAYAAARCQEIGQRDPARSLSGFVGQDRIEPRSAPGPETSILAKADMSMRPTFSCTLRHSRAHEVEIVGAAEAPFIARALSRLRRRMVLVQQHVRLREVRVAQSISRRREEIRPLPTIDRAEHSAERLHPVVARRLPQRPRGDALFVGIVDGEDLGIGLLVLFDEIARLRVRAEAPWIDARACRWSARLRRSIRRAASRRRRRR